MLESEKEYLLEAIPVDAKVLDIGCGTGRNIKIISEKTGYITGVDVDEDAIDSIRAIFTSVATTSFVHADARKLPFEENTFDIVTFLEIIGNLGENKKSALKEAVRVLKKDGLLIVNAYSEDALPERLKMYEVIGVPIEKVEGTTVIFPGIDGGSISEQFSKEEIRQLVAGLNLEEDDCKKMGEMEYIFKFRKL
jgi:ubiquinone/menaquinone biosynthesis C-methylase UbiE